MGWNLPAPCLAGPGRSRRGTPLVAQASSRRGTLSRILPAARRIVSLASLSLLAQDCSATGHGEAPHLADSLWRYCGISCSAQAVDAPGAGSGWQHSRLIWALFAVFRDCCHGRGRGWGRHRAYRWGWSEMGPRQGRSEAFPGYHQCELVNSQ